MLPYFAIIPQQKQSVFHYVTYFLKKLFNFGTKFAVCRNIVLFLHLKGEIMTQDRLDV